MEADALSPPFHGNTRLLEQLQKCIQVGGLLRQSIVEQDPELVTMGGLGPVSQPSTIMFAVAFGILHDGISVLDADGITQPPDRPPGAKEIPEFLFTVQRGGVPNDMIMNMLFVDVGTDDKSVMALGEAFSKLHTQAIGFLRGDLAGGKGLPDLIGNYIIRPPLSPGLGGILTFGKKELSVSDPTVTLIAGDKSAAVRFFRVLYIVQDVADCRPRRPALAGVQGYDTGRCYFESPPYILRVV